MIARSGTGSDGTRQLVSPAIPSASRLVARIVRPGHGAEQRIDELAHSRSGARSCRAPGASGERAAGPSSVSSSGPARLPRADVERGRDRLRDQCRVGERRQLDQPHAVGKRSSSRRAPRARAASCRTRRRPSASAAASTGKRRASSAISRWRPMKLVSGAGRLCLRPGDRSVTDWCGTAAGIHRRRVARRG